MGALLTAWQARISAQRRIELTNQDTESASTENTTVSGAAETDSSNTFIHMTGVAFDSTNTEHLSIGCLGLTYYLFVYRGLGTAKVGQDAFQVWKTACDAFARTRGSMAWQSPLTNATQSPTRDDTRDLPYFDIENFKVNLPPPPGAVGWTDTRVGQ
jgi:hypothetical protein